jgi:hypothetical protein
VIRVWIGMGLGLGGVTKTYLPRKLKERDWLD